MCKLHAKLLEPQLSNNNKNNEKYIYDAKNRENQTMLLIDEPASEREGHCVHGSKMKWA